MIFRKTAAGRCSVTTGRNSCGLMNFPHRLLPTMLQSQELSVLQIRKYKYIDMQIHKIEIYKYLRINEIPTPPSPTMLHCKEQFGFTNKKIHIHRYTNTKNINIQIFSD